MTFYETMYKIFARPVKWLYRIKTVGEENIPEGGCIIAANHTAFSDVLLISAAAKRQVRYMAKAELFKTPLKPLITALGAYPVSRGGADVGSIKKTIALLSEGELVGIFPQGHRYGKQDPRYTEIKSGIGMIAYHAKTTVVPVFIDNKRGKTGILRRNTVIFGAPVSFEELGYTSGGKVEYMNAAKHIFRCVCELKYGKADTWEKDPFLPETVSRKDEASGGEQA